MVFHPAWGYFADEFGLKQLPIEIGGREPGPRELGRIIDYAREKGIGAIFVQEQFSRRAAEKISDEIDGQVIQIDPLAFDYIENLKYIADLLSAEL